MLLFVIPKCIWYLKTHLQYIPISSLKQFNFEIDNGQPEKKTCITMEEWIDVWGTIVGKAKRMDDFPMWLQYYPKVLFDIINRSGILQLSHYIFAAPKVAHSF